MSVELTPKERKAIREHLTVSASYLRSLVDMGPRMSPLLVETLQRYASEAESLRVRLGGKA